MLKIFSVLFTVIAFGGMAQASNYYCNASFSYLDSQLWNAGYQFSLRPGFNGTATAHVRLNRNYAGAGLPRVEVIQMNCVRGSDGAEYDCAEFGGINQRNEMLAAQFFPNGWATLYATPWNIWQPYALGNVQCLRM